MRPVRDFLHGWFDDMDPFLVFFCLAIGAVVLAAAGFSLFVVLTPASVSPVAPHKLNGGDLEARVAQLAGDLQSPSAEGRVADPMSLAMFFSDFERVSKPLSSDEVPGGDQLLFQLNPKPTDFVFEVQDPELHGAFMREPGGRLTILWCAEGSRFEEPIGMWTARAHGHLFGALRQEGFTYAVETALPHPRRFYLDDTTAHWKVDKFFSTFVPDWSVPDEPPVFDGFATDDWAADSQKELEYLASIGVDITTVPKEYLSEFEPVTLSGWTSLETD